MWIEDEAVLAAERADFAESGSVIVGGFNVNTDEICARFRECLDVAMRLAEHEVGIKKKSGAGAPESGEQRGAERQIGDKVTVHYIEMNPSEAKFGNLLGGTGEVGVVAGED